MHERALMRDLVRKYRRASRARRARACDPRRRAARRAVPFHARALPGALRGRDARHGGRGRGGRRRRSTRTSPPRARRASCSRASRSRRRADVPRLDRRARRGLGRRRRPRRAARRRRVVPLAFVPDAAAGAHLLVHLGIPVEVLDPAAAREALALRHAEEAVAMSSTRATGIALAFVTARRQRRLDLRERPRGASTSTTRPSTRPRRTPSPACSSSRSRSAARGAARRGCRRRDSPAAVARPRSPSASSAAACRSSSSSRASRAPRRPRRRSSRRRSSSGWRCSPCRSCASASAGRTRRDRAARRRPGLARGRRRHDRVRHRARR